MKTTKMHALLCALLLILSLLSCKKSESGNNGGSASRAKLLVGGKWTLQSYEYQKPDGTWDKGPINALTFEFHEDKSVVSVLGSSSALRAWVLSDDGGQLTITRVGGGADTYKILQLTSSLMQISKVGYSSSAYVDSRDTYTR
ncbi:hypothetical protein [Mucilaginibacter sp. HD30]